SNPMLLPPPKRPNAQCTSFTIALACATQSFTPRVCAPPPASSRLDARWGSGPASNAPACTGPSTAQTPSSPCAAPNSADALRTSGSAAPTGLPHDVIPQNRRAPIVAPHPGGNGGGEDPSVESPCFQPKKYSLPGANRARTAAERLCTADSSSS